MIRFTINCCFRSLRVDIEERRGFLLMREIEKKIKQQAAEVEGEGVDEGAGGVENGADVVVEEGAGEDGAGEDEVEEVETV